MKLRTNIKVLLAAAAVFLIVLAIFLGIRRFGGIVPSVPTAEPTAALTEAEPTPQPLPPHADALRITELMPANHSTLPDESLAFRDWIELTNTGETPVPLGGLYLSNDRSRPDKLALPEQLLAGGERAVIFCDDSFSLSRHGEVLLLSTEDGQTLHEVSYAETEADCAVVFTEEGAALSDLATPGYPNTEQGYEDFLAASDRHGAVVINEIVSFNDNYESQHGKYYDWIELENPGNAEVGLTGWRLSDDADLRGAYVFGNVTLAPGDTLVAYCAPRPDDAPEDAVFTGFKLDSDGELVLLVDPHERVVEALGVPAMKSDWVYLRDENGEWTQERALSEGSDTSLAIPMSGLRINEVMPVNHETLPDGDGDYSDWLELYNAGDSPVSLGRYSLSDVEGKPDRWRFPDIVLKPGEYLVVFASGKNRQEPGGELHTNFRLSASDGAVRLCDPKGKEIARLNCDSEEADVSVSVTDGGETTKTYVPTPGYQNSESGIPDELPQVTQNAYGLYINELMNVHGGDDWAEIVNVGPTDVDLTGMGLSNHPARPRKWQFPSGATIPSGGTLLVSLAGEGATTSAPYNANFKLSTGDTLCLSAPDGTVIDRVKLYAQPLNVSYGRADGEARYRYFAEPTPGRANASQSYANQVKQVTFSQRGGLHNETSLTVTLNSDDGAAIYYTTDGSLPTTSSNRYAGPLTLTATTVLRAVATRDGLLPSEQSAATYVLGESHPNMYTVCVSGDYEKLIGESGCMNTGFKKDDCDVFVEIYDADGKPLIGQACNLMVAGNANREKDPQKAFRLKARAEYGDSRFRAKLFSNREYTVFKSITLRASGQDDRETHMKDSVLSALAADTGVMYLESEVAVVYIDGRYWGLYNLRERVTPVAVAQFEGWSDSENIVLLNPETAEQGRSDSYKALMKWLAGADLTDPEDMALLKQYVDVENYLDYVALEMYLSNLDLSNVRYYCNPTLGARWKWILFDLDLAFRVDRNTARDWLAPGGVGTITPQDNTLFVKLMEDTDTRDYFLRRMGDLLRTTFSAENVVGRIEARRDLIAPEMAAHCARWGWSLSTWQKYVNRIIDYAGSRPKKLVEYIALSFGLTEAQAVEYFAGVE